MRLIVAVVILSGGISGVPRQLSIFGRINAMEAIGILAHQTHFKSEVLVLQIVIDLVDANSKKRM